MASATARIDVFHAVDDPTRRAILDRLRDGSASVGALASGFAMTRPAVSKHLKLLREAELVREHKRGRYRIYELSAAPLQQIAEWAESYRAFWATNLMALKRHVERSEP
jgi:DNA-binding transcriptional ArsR family regulator